MKKPDNKFLLSITAGILLSLASWTLVSINNIQTNISSIQNELRNVDKQFGRIFYWFDKFTSQ